MRAMAFSLPHSEQAWKARLTPEQYRVLREKGTEAPFSGEYVRMTTMGMYRCAACGATLFSSNAKFDSGSGWPSFTEPANRAHVILEPDDSLGLHRTAVRCKHCGSHLGHVFEDGPAARGGKRYCINSCALKLEPKEE